MRVALRLAIPTLIAGVTLVACASTSGSGTSAAPATSAPTATPAKAAVNIKGFAFSPATLTVSKGTIVTFTNQDSATHSVSSGTSRTKDNKFDQQISGSAEASVTFDTVGTFEYFCQFHSSMKGTVTVQ